MDNVTYKDGNVKVTINLKTGTRIEETEKDEQFNFDYPTSIDLNISSLCQYNCPFCYAGNGRNGKDADLSKYEKFFDSLHPYTEVAVNGNDGGSAVVYNVLSKLKERNIIGNLTVNEQDFIKNSMLLDGYMSKGFVHGLGISIGTSPIKFNYVYNNLKRDMRFAPNNIVFHVINGLWSKEMFNDMKDKGVKVLVLGYKDTGRGASYKAKDVDNVIDSNIQWLREHFGELLYSFDTVGFDNLACDQLHVKEYVEKHSELGVKWEDFYNGDDGTQSMYVDLVTGTYALNSMTAEKYSMENMDYDINKMFANIKRRYNK